MSKPESIIHVRLDTPHSTEVLVTKFCKKHFSAYVYGMEKGKVTDKEHFHITAKTYYHIDTIRRKVSKTFKLCKSELSVKTARNTKKAIAYTIKDGKYQIVNWPQEEIEQAKQYKDAIQVEQQLKNLSDKCIAHLNTLTSDWTMQNTDLMFAILKWFKEKNLNYPAQHWMKSTMIKYYMQNPTDGINLRNIETLYNIRNAFIDEKNI